MNDTKLTAFYGTNQSVEEREKGTKMTANNKFVLMTVK
jgi:hypothetical protein